MKILTLYVLFSAVATLLNILGQDISLRLFPGNYSVPFSILIGTGIGLVVKYILDKQYIFNYRSNNLLENGKKFFVYSLMGIITTLIFWLCEMIFEYIFHDKYWRYFGAVIGLSIGYFIKYQLDKHYVFRVAQ